MFYSGSGTHTATLDVSWYDYETAAHDMVKYTSTHVSPWEIIPANNKNFARIKVLETFGNYLEAALSDG